jgi:hypothetical protein
MGGAERKKSEVAGNLRSSVYVKEEMSLQYIVKLSVYSTREQIHVDKEVTET